MDLDPKRGWLGVALSAIVVLMGIEIVYLIHQNRELRSIVDNPRKYYQPLSPGEAVPSFTAQDVQGLMISVQYSATQPYRLLMWFSPGCESCDENLGFWNDLFDQYDSKDIRLLGICPDSPTEVQSILGDYDLKFPVLCSREERAVQAYKGHIVPQTMLIAPEGIVISVWPGPLNESHRHSITASIDSLVH